MRNNRGEISLAAVFVVLLCIGVIFVGPVVIMLNHRDNTIVAKAQAEIDEAVQEVAVKGVLTQEMADRIEERLPGGPWTVEITIQRKDDNPLVKSAKITTADGTVYIVDYDTNVRDDLNKYGEITLKEGDIVLFTATITKDTIGSSFLGAQGTEQGTTTVQSSAKVSGK